MPSEAADDLRIGVDALNKIPAEEMRTEWRYAPVVIILKTETEYHDRMRELLFYVLR